MRNKLYYLGYSKGWKMATRYASGTKAERRDVRNRLALLNESYGQFAEGLWDGFGDLSSQRSESILKGLAPRTINPHRLAHVLERIG